MLTAKCTTQKQINVQVKIEINITRNSLTFKVTPSFIVVITIINALSN